MQSRTSKGRLQATRGDVERAVTGWLEENAGDELRILSAWESHCFAQLLTFLRYGYYDRAMDQFAYVMDPPIPMPAFPLHHLMTLEQVKAAFPEHRPAAAARDAGDGQRDSADD